MTDILNLIKRRIYLRSKIDGLVGDQKTQLLPLMEELKIVDNQIKADYFNISDIISEIAPNLDPYVVDIILEHVNFVMINGVANVEFINEQFEQDDDRWYLLTAVLKEIRNNIDPT